MTRIEYIGGRKCLNPSLADESLFSRESIGPCVGVTFAEVLSGISSLMLAKSPEPTLAASLKWTSPDFIEDTEDRSVAWVREERIEGSELADEATAGERLGSVGGLNVDGEAMNLLARMGLPPACFRALADVCWENEGLAENGLLFRDGVGGGSG